EDVVGSGASEQGGLEDVFGLQRGGDVEAGYGAVAIERITGVAGAVESEIIGSDAKVCGDEDRVSGEVDDGDEARTGRTGAGDGDGVFGRLRCGADGIEGAHDWTVGIAAAENECRRSC